MVKVTFLITLFLSTTIALPFPIERSNDYLMPISRSLENGKIPDQYIVVFNKTLTGKQVSDHYDDIDTMLSNDEDGLKARAADTPYGVKSKYKIGSFQGYFGTFSKSCINKIKQRSEVAYVEQNQKVFATQIQNNAPPGLVRISHKDATGQTTYEFDPIAGKDTNIYIVDTGIKIDHTDFGGRARVGATIPDGAEDTDNEGHGSHVAGTAAGTKFGVAKNANLIAVKVLGDDGSGSTADVIKGVEFAADDHKKTVAAAKASGKTFKGSVANLSLGGGKSLAVEQAVNSAVDDGMVVVVAAGNDDVDACTQSPAAATKVISVAAIDDTDTRAFFSNFGKCVDIFATGVDVLSVGIKSTTDTQVLSGTSMSSPHVAGLASYFLSLSDTPLTPQQLRDKLLSVAITDAVGDVKGSPNLLAFNDNPNDK